MMDTSGDCGLLCTVLVMRHRSGASVCRSVWKLVDLHVVDPTRARDRCCLAHGVYFITVGLLQNLAWLRAELDGMFGVKTTVVAHSGDADVVSEGHILNRSFRAMSAGWEYECGQRPVEVLIEESELAALRPATMPGVAEAVDKSQVGVTMADDYLDSVSLVGESATRYRALAARCNYITAGRADAQH